MTSVGNLNLGDGAVMPRNAPISPAVNRMSGVMRAIVILMFTLARASARRVLLTRAPEDYQVN